MARHDDEREKRLAEALRENLRRRKAQARGEEAPSPSHPADAGRAPPSPLEGEGYRADGFPSGWDAVFGLRSSSGFSHVSTRLPMLTCG
jgi:hypothetical protein